ncbi:hypothetical protein BDY17DRAFT_294917 [Neohortaea acidophila]|uniref:Uncharacterized protein n=1 Tax=Neohortaea acidophila TaxID=245834 RepID=A0A6A6PWC0_9PEZI|nr:uncharacterized protein BDY17DRAFT_294917 [Neohortaea acidophila]KAF2484066.1 hypothetical protein BDY17DRAFT_294917 [Neohortaea acidophila]
MPRAPEGPVGGAHHLLHAPNQQRMLTSVDDGHCTPTAAHQRPPGAPKQSNGRRSLQAPKDRPASCRRRRPSTWVPLQPLVRLGAHNTRDSFAFASAHSFPQNKRHRGPLGPSDDGLLTLLAFASKLQRLPAYSRERRRKQHVRLLGVPWADLVFIPSPALVKAMETPTPQQSAPSQPAGATVPGHL